MSMLLDPATQRKGSYLNHCDHLFSLLDPQQIGDSDHIFPQLPLRLLATPSRLFKRNLLRTLSELLLSFLRSILDYLSEIVAIDFQAILNRLAEVFEYELVQVLEVREEKRGEGRVELGKELKTLARVDARVVARGSGVEGGWKSGE